MEQDLALAGLPDAQPLKGNSAKRASIVEAAKCAFCEHGLSGTSIDDIAARAQVSRQTVYNHYRDKDVLFLAVVEDVLARANANVFGILSTFPQSAENLEHDLEEFLTRLNRNCVFNRDGRFLRKLVQTEGERFPHLFKSWREQGPLKLTSAIAALLARLAVQGALVIDDFNVASRQFLALGSADIHMQMLLGETPSDAELKSSARNAVRTFLKAYGNRGA